LQSIAVISNHQMLEFLAFISRRVLNFDQFFLFIFTDKHNKISINKLVWILYST